MLHARAIAARNAPHSAAMHAAATSCTARAVAIAAAATGRRSCSSLHAHVGSAISLRGATVRRATQHAYALSRAPSASALPRSSPGLRHSSAGSRLFSSDARGGGSNGGSELVAWAGEKDVTTPGSAFLPVGQMPKSPQLLLLPAIRPVMPGLAFELDLRMYPASTRAALVAALASKQPYVALVMLQQDAVDAVAASARTLGGWTREERVREGLEADPAANPHTQPTQQMSRGPGSDVFEDEGFARLLQGGGAQSKFGADSGVRLPLFPVLTDTSTLHGMGVAAEFKITVKDNVPRLQGIAHRRVQILGVAEQPVESHSDSMAIPTEHTAAEPTAESQESQPAEPAQHEETTTPSTDVAASDAPSDAVASAPAVDAAASDSTATAATSAVSASDSADSSDTSDADQFPPQLPTPVGALCVRVRHLEDTPPVVSVDASSDVSSTRQSDVELAAYVKEINQTVSELAAEDYVAQRMKRLAQVARHLPGMTHPARVADLAAYISNATPAQLQSLLETLDVKARLDGTLWLWKREREEVRLRKEVARSVKDKFESYHNKMLLKEQKKVLDEAMAHAAREKNSRANAQADAEGKTRPPPPPPGSGNDKESLRARYLHRIHPSQGKDVPAEARKVIEDEIAKLMSLDSDASEFQLTRNYIDWLTILPWNKVLPEKFDLEFAESLLDAEHHGLEEVKTRILEFIASGVLLARVPPGKILCLVGPPGVGKTSIGKSIAAALGRQFHRIAVGGLDDVSEIKGHRRTYVGSMPGKLLQALRRVQCANPVILIDEVDKLGRGHRGDPAAALLEVLDPEQNNSFADHYLDVPVDLSKVLFICTANERSPIPGPLADRMDFIELSGYVLQEKLHIAERHLLPQIALQTGVNASSVTVTQDALRHLIRWYCREAGVRGLQKQIEKIFRKVALKIARAQDLAQEEADRLAAQQAAEAAAAKPAGDAAAVQDAEIIESPTTASSATIAPGSSLPAAAAAVLHSLQLPLTIGVPELLEYLGKPVHSSDRMYESNPIGVATGLGTNSLGGSLLYIECTTADQQVTLPEEAMRVPTPNAPVKPAGGRAPQVLNRGELFCTGQLGDVIRESSSIAYTVAKRLVAQYTHADSPHRAFFGKHRIHLHMPEGSTPKDGPSAGIAMVTALLSLALDCAPLHAHAMTGELTLTGLVLPIGGVKEKLMAAKHAGISTIVLPVDNQKDVAELKPYITEGMTIHYAHTYDDVFKLIFPHFVDVPLPAPVASTAAASAAHSTAAAELPLAEGAPVEIDTLTTRVTKGVKRSKDSKDVPKPILPVQPPPAGKQPSVE